MDISEINSGAQSGPNWSAKIDQSNLLASMNPATEEIIAQVGRATAEDYEYVIDAAQKAFHNWSQVPAPKRGEFIRAIADELRSNKDALGTLVSQETGKIKQEGDGEVQEMIDIADFAVGLSRMLYGKTMHSERPKHRMYEQWHPLGVCGVITAFNFPVAVWAWNAFIAAVCGNTVVWKPSPKTPLCAIAVQNICNKVMKEFGFTGIFNLVINDEIEFAKNMVDDKRLPLISFTGSTNVGREVAQQVSKRLGRSLLELSGNNAIIVAHDADLSKAVPSIVFGSVGTAGQRCTSTRRIIVHQSRIDELVKQLISAYEQVSIGDPLNATTLMGPLIDQDALDCYKSAIEEIKSLGGDIIFGGNILEGPGHFVEPTIVLAKNDWDIVGRETFGPILYVMPYDELNDAIQMQNEVDQGLSSAIFTEGLNTAEQYLSVLGSDCGIANVNIGTSGAEIGGAFGGEKDTGGGREAGSDAWKAYMRRQTNTINWSDELPLAQGIKFNIS